MGIIETILEILKYTIPALVVFFTAYFLIKAHLDSEYKKRHLELRMANQAHALPIRLQAYERLTLFLERISPNNVIPRVRRQDMNARDLQLALLTNIRNEYDHNLSQQIYVSPEAWHLITTVKEEIITTINRVGSTLPHGASSIDLSKGIFEYFVAHERAIPTQKAMDILKAEIKKIY